MYAAALSVVIIIFATQRTHGSFRVRNNNVDRFFFVSFFSVRTSPVPSNPYRIKTIWQYSSHTRTDTGPGPRAIYNVISRAAVEVFFSIFITAPPHNMHIMRSYYDIHYTRPIINITHVCRAPWRGTVRFAHEGQN